MNEDTPRSAWSVGLRYGSDFFAGVLVGTVLGFGADALFSSAPIGLIAGMFLGFAAGTLNVVRTAQELNAQTGDDTSTSTQDENRDR
ncbi:AtpZ/AtpI family protein [Maricaulis sp. D1M11]|uniref:AtpZ/AtpI family protein n=1 Tax=Maricaulis sp. D1M11 TaxID=3076117 RepID=UPI0039B44C09